VAANRLAALHVFFGVGLRASPACIAQEFEGLNNTENSVLSLLGRVLYSFAPLEFPYGALERRLTF
jgi:hypothetical protein